MKKYLLFLSCFLILFNVCKSQEIVKIKGVKGDCVISNITPEEAKQNAIKAAKHEAIRRAGVSETVLSLDMMRTMSKNGNLKESFNSLVHLNIAGNVVDWKLISEKKIVDEFGNLIYEVVIDTKVIKYKNDKDPMFKLSVNGVKSVYESGSDLHFNIKAYKSGFLKVFLIGDTNEVSVLFPNSYESLSVLEKDKSYSFPVSDLIDYKLRTNLKKEHNIILFVLLKENSVPECDNEKDLFQWLYSFKRNMVYYEFDDFRIVNGNR